MRMIIDELAEAQREVERLQTAYDALTGEKFSDRIHLALKDRAQKAEARCARLETFVLPLLDEFGKLEIVHEAPGHAVFATVGLLKITCGEMRQLRAALAEGQPQRET